VAVMSAASFAGRAAIAENQTTTLASVQPSSETSTGACLRVCETQTGKSRILVDESKNLVDAHEIYSLQYKSTL